MQDKPRLPHSRYSEAGSEQRKEVLVWWYSTGCLQTQGGRMCVFAWWGWWQCDLSFMECYAVLQALQLMQTAATTQKCLSDQQHKPHGWYLCCSCINGKGKELNVIHSFCSKNEEHLVHISAFKQIVIQHKSKTPLSVYTLQYGKTCYFQEEALWGIYWLWGREMEL